MTGQDVRKALCWEMVCGTAGIEGWRFVVADRFVLVQERPSGNLRPKWTVSDLGGQEEATRGAVEATDRVERVYGARLTGEPVEVVLHDAEAAALRNGGRIPPTLRARVFVALQRIPPALPAR